MGPFQMAPLIRAHSVCFHDKTCLKCIRINAADIISRQHFQNLNNNFTTFQQYIAKKMCFTFKLSDVVIIVLINIMPTMLAF